MKTKVPTLATVRLLASTYQANLREYGERNQATERAYCAWFEALRAREAARKGGGS